MRQGKSRSLIKFISSKKNPSTDFKSKMNYCIGKMAGDLTPVLCTWPFVK